VPSLCVISCFLQLINLVCLFLLQRPSIFSWFYELTARRFSLCPFYKLLETLFCSAQIKKLCAKNLTLCFQHNNLFSGSRRRSLSPLSLSLLANYGSKEAINSITPFQISPQNTDLIFRRSSITPRRRFHSMTGEMNGNGVHVNGKASPTTNKPPAKPPTVSKVFSFS
jgi:hypothetical protein